MTKFSKKEIKKAMVDKDFKQGELAKQLGICVSALSAKLKGKRKFTIEEIIKISEILEVNVCNFFKEGD